MRKKIENKMARLRKPVKALSKYLPDAADGDGKIKIAKKPTKLPEYLQWEKELKELSKEAFRGFCEKHELTEQQQESLSFKKIATLN